MSALHWMLMSVSSAVRNGWDRNAHALPLWERSCGPAPGQRVLEGEGGEGMNYENGLED